MNRVVKEKIEKDRITTERVEAYEETNANIYRGGGGHSNNHYYARWLKCLLVRIAVFSVVLLSIALVGANYSFAAKLSGEYTNLGILKTNPNSLIYSYGAVFDVAPPYTGSVYEVTFRYRKTCGNATYLNVSPCLVASWATGCSWLVPYGTDSGDSFSFPLNDFNWHTATINIANKGYRQLLFNTSGQYTGAEVEVLSAKWYDYYPNIRVNISVNNNKQVVVSMTFDEPMISKFLWKVVNDVTENATSSEPISAASDTSWTDVSVQAEKYYSYSIYYGCGVYANSSYQNISPNPIRKDIFVPSDATLAKTAAEQAKISADTAVKQTIYNGQSAAYWAYQAAQAANTPPIITKVQGQNGATCTRGNSFALVVTASDNEPPSNLRYRVTCDSYDSGWSSSNILTVTGLSVPGAKTATIMVSDNPSAPDSGNIAQTTFTFFKI